MSKRQLVMGGALADAVRGVEVDDRAGQGAVDAVDAGRQAVEPRRPAAPRPGIRRAEHPSRSGTARNPYPRSDGHETIKITVTVTGEFHDRLRAFLGTLPRGATRNAWIEEALTRAMREEGRRR